MCETISSVTTSCSAACFCSDLLSSTSQVMFTLFPDNTVSGYGVRVPDTSKPGGRLVVHMSMSCGALALGFAVVLLHPLIYGGGPETIRLALLSYGVASGVQLLLTFFTQWPDLSRGGEIRHSFALAQDLLLTFLPLSAHSKVPESGYNKIYSSSDLLSLRWWLCIDSLRFHRVSRSYASESLSSIASPMKQDVIFVTTPPRYEHTQHLTHRRYADPQYTHHSYT